MFDRNTMRALALASQIGFAIACPLLVCAGGGFWLGREWGVGPWLGIAGLLFGLIAAGYSIYELSVAIPARQRARETGQSQPTHQDTDDSGAQ